MPWMHVKLGFVFALYLYQKMPTNFNQLQNKLNTQPTFARLWNEGATIILLQ
jgi:putative membrane protein